MPSELLDVCGPRCCSSTTRSRPESQHSGPRSSPPAPRTPIPPPSAAGTSSPRHPIQPPDERLRVIAGNVLHWAAPAPGKLRGVRPHHQLPLVLRYLVSAQPETPANSRSRNRPLAVQGFRAGRAHPEVPRRHPHELHPSEHPGRPRPQLQGRGRFPQRPRTLCLGCGCAHPEAARLIRSRASA